MLHNPSTIDAQEIDKFAKQSSHWWDLEGPFKTLHDINSLRLEFISSQKPLNNLRVLDLGCGGGILTESLAKRGAQVTGIDAGVEAIDAAIAHNNRQLPIEYLCLAVEDYDKEEAFDVITCMEMLEHVPNPALIFEQCKRLLKPQGFLFVSTINRTLNSYATTILAAEYVLGLLPRQTHDYHKFIKPSELAAIARHLDFKLLSLKGMDYNPFTRHASLSAKVSANYLMSLQRES